MQYREFNFDGLVGPTHNYAGLSFGNVASSRNRASRSNPRKAALQGLEKAWELARRGHAQGVLPPHERPSIEALRGWGFTGNDEAAVLANAASRAPQLLAAASSASAMWTANACTMTPSCDSADGLAHFTPANLESNLHRSMEAAFTEKVLRAIFGDSTHFKVHPPLAGGAAMADEGAANHTRLAGDPSKKGLHLFVFGRSTFDKGRPAPVNFPARQTLESAQAIARLHGIGDRQAVFLQQNPKAIDAGVFHNDVISVGHGDTFLYHEEAFLNGKEDVRRMGKAFQALAGRQVRAIAVEDAEVSIAEVVRTYLFNSQLLARQEGGLLMVSPAECRESPAVSQLLDSWLANSENPVGEVLTLDLRESMRNGGGPACLRQRIVLSEAEAGSIGARVLLDESLYAELVDWVKRWYREELYPEDLADPQLLDASRRALDDLTRILRLPALYPFQTRLS